LEKLEKKTRKAPTVEANTTQLGVDEEDTSGERVGNKKNGPMGVPRKRSGPVVRGGKLGWGALSPFPQGPGGNGKKNLGREAKAHESGVGLKSTWLCVPKRKRERRGGLRSLGGEKNISRPGGLGNFSSRCPEYKKIKNPRG